MTVMLEQEVPLILGDEIHKVEEVIHMSKIAIKELHDQEPIDGEALAIEYERKRTNHHRRHELERLQSTNLYAGQVTVNSLILPKPWR